LVRRRAVWSANLIGVTAVTNKAVVSLGCRGSTGVGSMHRVLGIVPVQQCWSEAELSGVQDLIGVTAVTNCCLAECCSAKQADNTAMQHHYAICK